MSELLLQNLEIRQFRKFDILTIERLGQVNLIVGKNNVGKSTILEAIRLYASIGSPRVIWDILAERDDLTGGRGVARILSGDDSVAVWSLFHGYPLLESINTPIQIGPISRPDSTLSLNVEWFVEARDEAGRLLFTEAPPADVGRGAETIPALTVRIAAVRRVLRLDQDFRTHCRRWDFQPRAFRDLASRCVSVGSNGLRPRQVEKMWGAIALTALERDVVESLRIIAPDVEDFALLKSERSKRTSIRLKTGRAVGPVPLRSMGDGMNRLFGLAIALVNASGGLLLVDEIENGIHYSALTEVWKFVARVARRLNVQVFATTHSADCVRAFHDVTRADPSVEGILNRLEMKQGQIRAVLFDERRLERFLEEGIEMR